MHYTKLECAELKLCQKQITDIVLLKLPSNYRFYWNRNLANFSSSACNSKKSFFTSTCNEITASVRCVYSKPVVLDARLDDKLTDIKR